jgi:hypothetical protein
MFTSVVVSGEKFFLGSEFFKNLPAKSLTKKTFSGKVVRFFSGKSDLNDS